MSKQSSSSTQGATGPKDVRGLGNAARPHTTGNQSGGNSNSQTGKK